MPDPTRALALAVPREDLPNCLTNLCLPTNPESLVSASLLRCPERVSYDCIHTWQGAMGVGIISYILYHMHHSRVVVDKRQRAHQHPTSYF